MYIYLYNVPVFRSLNVWASFITSNAFGYSSIKGNRLCNRIYLFAYLDTSNPHMSETPCVNVTEIGMNKK